MSRAVAIALLGCGGCLFPAADATHRYACGTDTDCPSGYCASDGHCASGVRPARDGGPDARADAGLDAGADAGPDAGAGAGGACLAPSCASSSAFQLCDGGLVSCAGNEVCDYGACVAPCAACGAGVCDVAENACLSLNHCPCDAGLLCAGTLCAPPPLAGSVACGLSPAPPDAGAPLTVSGLVTAFPAGSPVALDGGTVTFLFDGGQLSALIQPSLGDAYRYSIGPLPEGPATALVQGAGLVPTYFPNLLLSPSPNQELDLPAVVPSAFVATLPTATAPGHLIWVGQAICGTSYLSGYTVGCSPAAPFVGNYVAGTDGPTLGSGTSSDPALGEFAAWDAPRAVTSYELEVSGPTPVLQGTFAPPGDGGTVAVALIYPNFCQ